jgi:hypothetical protein
MRRRQHTVPVAACRCGVGAAQRRSRAYVGWVVVSPVCRPAQSSLHGEKAACSRTPTSLAGAVSAGASVVLAAAAAAARRASVAAATMALKRSPVCVGGESASSAPSHPLCAAPPAHRCHRGGQPARQARSARRATAALGGGRRGTKPSALPQSPAASHRRGPRRSTRARLTHAPAVSSVHSPTRFTKERACLEERHAAKGLHECKPLVLGQRARGQEQHQPRGWLPRRRHLVLRAPPGSAGRSGRCTCGQWTSTCLVARDGHARCFGSRRRQPRAWILRLGLHLRMRRTQRQRQHPPPPPPSLLLRTPSPFHRSTRSIARALTVPRRVIASSSGSTTSLNARRASSGPARQCAGTARTVVTPGSSAGARTVVTPGSSAGAADTSSPGSRSMASASGDTSLTSGASSPPTPTPTPGNIARRGHVYSQHGRDAPVVGVGEVG